MNHNRFGSYFATPLFGLIPRPAVLLCRGDETKARPCPAPLSNALLNAANARCGIGGRLAELSSEGVSMRRFKHVLTGFLRCSAGMRQRCHALFLPCPGVRYATRFYH